VTELVLASGPLRYLGGSIETFALPMGAFIVIAWVLFYLYRRPHGVPRLRYLRPAHQVALGTREPGTEGIVYIASAAAASATAAPQAEAGADAEATAEVEAPAEAEAAAEVPVSSAGSEGSSAGLEESSDAPEESSDVEREGTSAEGETF